MTTTEEQAQENDAELDGVLDHITGERIQPKSYANSKVEFTQIKDNRGESVTIPRSWSMSSLVKSVMYDNKKCFTNILVLGLSTSGKTSFCRQLMHKNHTNPKYPEYNFKWFHGEQVMDIPKIVEELEPGMNYVCVFDDLSYVTDALGAKKKDLGKIGMDVNRIRHHLKGGRIILINCIHYMAGAQKGIFRDCKFTVATSITQNASEGLKNMFGKDHLVNSFARFDRQQNLQDHIDVPVSSWDGRKISLPTDSMRIGIVQELGWGHFFIWQDESCKQCNQDYYKDEHSGGKGEILTPEEFIGAIDGSYALSKVRQVLRWFAYIRTGNIMYLQAGHREIWRLINNVSMRTKLPYDELMKALDKGYKHPPYKRKNVTEDMQASKGELDFIMTTNEEAAKEVSEKEDV